MNVLKLTCPNLLLVKLDIIIFNYFPSQIIENSYNDGQRPNVVGVGGNSLKASPTWYNIGPFNTNLLTLGGRGH